MSVANSSKVEYAALHADEVCGAGTRLIYYMSAGDVLSRTFTRKDTHTPKGDLMVRFTDVDRVDPESARAMDGQRCCFGLCLAELHLWRRSYSARSYQLTASGTAPSRPATTAASF